MHLWVTLHLIIDDIFAQIQFNLKVFLSFLCSMFMYAIKIKSTIQTIQLQQPAFVAILLGMLKSLFGTFLL
jgi:hypothetical protein